MFLLNILYNLKEYILDNLIQLFNDIKKPFIVNLYFLKKYKSM